MNLPTSSFVIEANQQTQLILASTSRYRRELLERLRFPFAVQSPNVDETPKPNENPADLAKRLSLEKAQAVAKLYPNAVVIGSDQVADLNGQPLGKPETHDKAVIQLKKMRGETVLFQTAVSVVCLKSHFSQTALASVKVTFRDQNSLSDAQIETYLRTEKPYDCAGSAKSEGLGIALLTAIQSDDPTTLIGLPLIRTCHLIQTAGIVLF